MPGDPVIPLARPQPPCPICAKPARSGSLPFCSPRCRQIDLGRWLNGSYSVPTDDAPEDEMSEEGRP